MSQIAKKFVGANQIDDTKVRLSNNAALRARNAANSADVDMFKVNASDRVEFSSVPQATADPATGNDLARRSWVLSQVVADTFGKEALTLAGGDITNQYIDLAEEVLPNSLALSISGVMLQEGASYDYTLSTVSLVTRITFLNDISTGGPAALVAGDILHAMYRY